MSERGLRIVKRMLLVLTVALVMVAMMAATAGPVFADGRSACSRTIPEGAVGEFISGVAQEGDISAANNPGNSQNPAPPFVPFEVGCNPLTGV
jgi:hypothetical protein